VRVLSIILECIVLGIMSGGH